MDFITARLTEIRSARDAYLKEIDRINALRVELQRDEYNASRALEHAMIADTPSAILERESKRK